MSLIDTLKAALSGSSRLIVEENQRYIVFHKGQFKDILAAGAHLVPSNEVKLDKFQISETPFQAEYRFRIFDENSAACDPHFHEVFPDEHHFVVVENYGKIVDIIKPDTRVLFWKDAGKFTFTEHEVKDIPLIEKSMVKNLRPALPHKFIKAIIVPEGSIGVLFIDGAHAESLEAGTHYFWNFNNNIEVYAVESRWQFHEINGQEILSKDRLTIRINATARYRVEDPVKAIKNVKSFEDELHNAIQYVFRKTIGNQTLDQLLEHKLDIDAKLTKDVQKTLKDIGIEVGEIALKDVILPGEVREILNRVVSAQKEAEANVIKRREETNATRSLLNTAKVMADNPVMLRLKELEALENLAGNIQNLTIHSGTEGLMNDLVKLRE